MRILFDSKQTQFKSPFGTVTPGQEVTLTIHVPSSVQATGVTCIINHPDDVHAFNVPLTFKMKKGAYEIFQGKFSFKETGLFFYYFYIEKKGGNRRGGGNRR